MNDIRVTSGSHEFGTFSNLEAATSAARELVPAEHAVVFWSTAEDDGRRVLALRAAFGDPREVSFDFDPFAWWNRIPAETRALIASKPHGYFGSEEPLTGVVLIPEGARSGVAGLVSIGPANEPLPEGAMVFHEEVADFIDAISEA